MSGLGGQTPLARYQQDLPSIRTLGQGGAAGCAVPPSDQPLRAQGWHGVLPGQRFEVPYELAGKTVRLVVDPHADRVIGVEDEEGKSLGPATPLDAEANLPPPRRKPDPADTSGQPPSGPNLVELAYRQYHRQRRTDMYLQHFGLTHAPLGKESPNSGTTAPWRRSPSASTGCWKPRASACSPANPASARPPPCAN